MLGMLRLRTHRDVPVTRWSLLAAVVVGLLAALWLIPAWREQALVAQAMSTNDEDRASAWSTLMTPRPFSTSSRPRVTHLRGSVYAAMIDGAEDVAVLDAVAHLESQGMLGWHSSPPEVMLMAIGVHARAGGDHLHAARSWVGSAPPWHADQARQTLEDTLRSGVEIVTLPP